MSSDNTPDAVRSTHHEPRPTHDASSPGSAVPIDADHPRRDDVLARERETFGGFKFGSAFFGWLTATGTAVLLTAFAAAVGAAIGLSQTETADNADNAATDNAGTLGVVSAIVVGVILLVAYFAGGYVAGRMARFSGAKQGLAVWVWAIAIAVVVAVVTVIAGSQWDILGNLNSFPRIPVTPESATTAGILTALGAAVITLLGAILGGLAGMRYHRKVDRVGLGG
ncbi:hypothetical protein SAMN04487848_0171 [Microbacterium sp. ru370.1]|uniref:hypothetical protein n=1 Tax=unclassified Microbacterium TaxID=2609290 RepID=UPI0008866859|nr:MULTISPECIES: hypothetical protein [unclassified Microbacterium]SDO27976.1 hypothetical protein SAMN04487848_0171 [Microbacterium sp. ru370.1]SIT75004.1 hypothetical protein SAMN05880579_0167 [Microbacterium sp. RU1D]